MQSLCKNQSDSDETVHVCENKFGSFNVLHIMNMKFERRKKSWNDTLFFVHIQKFSIFCSDDDKKIKTIYYRRSKSK